MENILALFLLIHGLYSLYASYKGYKTIHLELPATTYISKKIFGEKFDKWHNFFWGIIELALGIGFLYFNLFN